MKKYRLSYLLRPLAFLINIISLNLAVLTSYFQKFNEIDTLFNSPYLVFYWVANLSWITILSITKPEHYSRLSFNITTSLFIYSKLVILQIAFISIFWITYKSYYYSREILFFTILYLFIYGIIWRLIGIELLKLYRSSGHNYRTFAILGSGELALQVQKYYASSPELGFKNLGVFENEPQTRNSFKRLLDLCKGNEVDVVYACLPYTDNASIEELIQNSENLPFEVKIISDFRGFFDKGISIEYHGHIPVLSVSKKPYSDPKVELLKRAFDVSFSLAVLIFGFPFFLIFFIITITTSKGPAFFLQKRTGRWGKEFDIIKFRSMFQNADQILEKTGAIDKHSKGNNDPRITKWGKFMRKTRIDELPQFINVLKGDMSVVGPRPLADYDVAELKRTAPEEFKKILTLRPGVTSIGQLESGYATNSKEMIERLKHDLIYLESYSFNRDINLIFKTITNMLKGSGM